MATQVIMPKVDMDQESGTLSDWLKQEGEAVTKGEPLLVMETDKVAIEVEAPASGILRGVRARKGDVVPIAQVIAYILAPGEELPLEETPAPVASAATPAEVTPVARRMAEAEGVSLAEISGTGPHGKITKNDVQAAAAPVKAGNGSAAGKINATPAARRTAREAAVDLHAVDGTGPQGRIQRDDVLSAAQSLPMTAPLSGLAPTSADVIIPLEGMRRTIAERLTASYQSIPHISFTMRVDMTRFNEARQELNTHAEASAAPHISATAMFVKAVGAVLLRHPWLNASLRGDEIRLRKDINIGVAVALDTGLIVPVMRSADRKGVVQIAAEVSDLSARARASQLVPADVTDGTFTISNLGPFGVEQFTAIINPPQVAILAIGATRLEAVPNDAGVIEARPIMRMTLSADHRVIDGAVAAHFITDLQAALELPMLLLW